MKTHYCPRPSYDDEIAACGTFMGEASEITGNWNKVTCKKCIRCKNRIMNKTRLTPAQKFALLSSRHSHEGRRRFIDAGDKIQRVTFNALERKGLLELKFITNKKSIVRDAGWRFWLTDDGENARAEILAAEGKS